MFHAGERVTLTVSGDADVAVGQRYVVRRPMAFRGAPVAQHTIGQVAIIEASESRVVAQVEMTCEAVSVGDYLEPFVEATLPADIERNDASGALDDASTMTVSYGVDGHEMGGSRDFMLATAGSDSDVVAGARYAIFHTRRSMGDPNQPFAEAIVVSVFPGLSLLRITAASDAVVAGDRLVRRVARGAAIHSQSRSGTSGFLPLALVDEQPASPAGEGGSTRLERDTADEHTLVFEDVHFDFNRQSLKKEAVALLDQAIRMLKEQPTLLLQVEGYTCDVGTAEYNLALAERRAKTVRSYLVSHGIDASRLSIISYGEDRAKYDNGQEETRKLNRRTALTVTAHAAN